MQKQNDPVDPWDARELGADEEFVQVAEYSQELELNSRKISIKKHPRQPCKQSCYIQGRVSLLFLISWINLIPMIMKLSLTRNH